MQSLNEFATHACLFSKRKHVTLLYAAAANGHVQVGHILTASLGHR